jgi:hypothetical protein
MKAMKKIIPMILACLFAFSACVSPNTPGTSVEDSSSSTGGVIDSSSSDVGGGDSSSSDVGGGEEDEGWKDNENVIVNNGTSNTPAQNVQEEEKDH